MYQVLSNSNANLQACKTAALEEIKEFREHLYSDEFCGFDSNGDRKDWIAVADVHARLSAIWEAIHYGKQD